MVDTVLETVKLADDDVEDEVDNISEQASATISAAADSVDAAQS